MSDLSLIVVLVFLAAALAVYAFYWVFFFNRREQHTINRRLELNRELRNASAVLATLRDERGIRNVSNPTLRQLSDWLTQTGTNMGRRNSILVFLALWLVLSIGLSETLALGFTAILLAAVVTAAMFILYLVRQRSQRISSFGEQLPDAIDIIVRGVRVGLPFI